MGLIGRQFGRPSGILGRLAGRFMAQNNAELNHWIAAQLATSLQYDPKHIVEVGAGPGVGTQALLARFPDAHVVAVDPSPAMQRQLLHRNRRAANDGRLEAVTGDLGQAGHLHDVDAVIAVHVLYFWREPIDELRRFRNLLRAGGVAALGYQLRPHMPSVAQRGFPASGHRVVEDDAEVRELLSAAGLHPQPVRILGDAQKPTGRLVTAFRQ